MPIHWFKIQQIFLISAHALKCIACGKATEGNETIYTGICKHEDDMGESRECDQIGYESVSCISLVLGKCFYNFRLLSSLIHIKNVLGQTFLSWLLVLKLEKIFKYSFIVQTNILNIVLPNEKCHFLKISLNVFTPTPRSKLPLLQILIVAATWILIWKIATQLLFTWLDVWTLRMKGWVWVIFYFEIQNTDDIIVMPNNFLKGTGVQCYCSSDDCNSSYGTTNSPSSRVTSPPTTTTTNEGSTMIGDIITPIIIVIVKFCFQVFE